MKLTLLSTIARPDFPVALQRQAEFGLRLLDLKNGLWGETIEQIEEATAERAAALCREHDLGVDNFATGIGLGSVDGRDGRARLSRRGRADSGTRLARRDGATAAPGETAFSRLQREFSWVIGIVARAGESAR